VRLNYLAIGPIDRVVRFLAHAQPVNALAEGPCAACFLRGCASQMHRLLFVGLRGSLLLLTARVNSKVGNILAKATALRINLNIDDARIASRAHTHPSHS
jgi:hypothetical protein